MSIFSTQTVTMAEAREILHDSLADLVDNIDHADAGELDDMLDIIVAGHGIYWRTNFAVEPD